MESGPAEVSGECRRHESGAERERGTPLVRGIRGISPENIFELSTPIRAFKCILEAFGDQNFKNLVSLT